MDGGALRRQLVLVREDDEHTCSRMRGFIIHMSLLAAVPPGACLLSHSYHLLTV